MTATNHYHDRIARATQRLAQLQARDLLASQRRDAKTREAAKRERARRHRNVACLVELAGADRLQDAELVGALLIHLDCRSDPSILQRAIERGASHLHPEGEPLSLKH